MRRLSLGLLLALSSLSVPACEGGAASADTLVERETEPAEMEEFAPMSGFSWVIAGQVAGMPRPGNRRPLEEDLAYLDEEGIRLLVSLTEDPTDPAALGLVGIDRAHIPIKDFTAPSLAQIHDFVERVRSSLASGEPVGVHCQGGHGRTGTMLAAYFVAEGMRADEAITEIRRLRPGSIETAEQEARIVEYADTLVDPATGR